MARGKKHAGGRPPLPEGAKKEKIQLMLDAPEMAELRRRREQTGATYAEMTRRAVKHWLGATKAVAFEVDEESYRRVTGKGETK